MTPDETARWWDCLWGLQAQKVRLVSVDADVLRALYRPIWCRPWEWDGGPLSFYGMEVCPRVSTHPDGWSNRA